MDNFYEMATIVLGCVVVVQYMAKKKHARKIQAMCYMLDQLAHRKWVIRTTIEGYAVFDEEGDTRFKAVDRSKQHG